MTLTIGTLLAQRYRLERKIAVGGMGEVWEAEDTRLGRQVAVKVLKQELSGDPEFRSRFHTEARLTASLNHPGIAAVHDYGETAAGGPDDVDLAFLVMELVAGESLAELLLRHPRLSVDRALDILGQAGEALQAAHERGLVHRDVKPGNILITPGGRVKLTDFGIARAVDTVPMTRQGMVMGTAHYIAPEQAAGQEAGPASDVYSLGVVGYECLAGRRPFVQDSAVAVAMMHIRDTPPPLPGDVPPGVRGLIEVALVKDPRQRYRTGGEFAAAAAAVRAGHRLPLPAALTGTAPTTVLGGHHPAQTALLPPGALSGPLPTPPRGAYPADYQPRDHPPQNYPPQNYPRQREPRRRPVTGVVVALAVLLALVLGGYLIREVLRSTDEAPGPAAVPTDTTDEPALPEDTAEEVPEDTAEETAEEPAPEPPAEAETEPETVIVHPGDYVGRSGSAAAANAEENGLEPVVVDEDGNEIDPEDQSSCFVVDNEPQFGAVEPGSTIVLTCREAL